MHQRKKGGDILEDKNQPKEDLKGTLFATLSLGFLMIISWIAIFLLYIGRF